MPLPVTFLFAGVLAAGAAAAAPVIIHLIMRTKPREIVFPALRFVTKSHRANISKLKLKHLLLLLMRIGAILLIAILIARPRLATWRRVVDRSLPTAVVFVVDNSGSMGYRCGGRSLLGRGKQLAQEVIESLPDRSRVAVITTASPSAGGAFLADLKLAAQQIADVKETFSATSVAPATARAAAMLKDIELPRKWVCLLSDMTGQSWRDGSGVVAEGRIDFTILNCAAGQGANVSIGALRVSSTQLPVGVDVTVETLVRSSQLSGEFDVRADLDGLAVDHQTVHLQAGDSKAVALTIRPKRQGVVHGKVSLGQKDALEMDNVRYFTLRVGSPATVLIVRDPATVGRGDETSFLMANAIAPAAARAGGTWVRRQTITADRLDAKKLAEVSVVLLADVASPGQAQWKSLADFVGRGGHLWVVVGLLVSPPAYNSSEAQRLMPLSLKSLEILDAPVGWRLDQAGHPMLAPFAGRDNPPLSEVMCRRRFTVQSTAEDANVLLRYTDAAPAIVLRTIGRGSVLIWNFSPSRSFSNLARLGQFPILVQQAIRLLVGGGDVKTVYSWGKSVTVPFPRSLPAAVVTVSRPSSQGEVPARASIQGRTVTLLADEAGAWTLRFSAGGRSIMRGFSVNPAAGESDLTPIEPSKVVAMFPSDSVLIARTAAEIAHKERMVARPLDLAVPILLVLLVLMTGESFFANRFYRRGQQVAPQ